MEMPSVPVRFIQELTSGEVQPSPAQALTIWLDFDNWQRLGLLEPTFEGFFAIAHFARIMSTRAGVLLGLLPPPRRGLDTQGLRNPQG